MESGTWVIEVINRKQYAQSRALPPTGEYYSPFQNRIRNVTMFCMDTHTYTHYTVSMM